MRVGMLLVLCLVVCSVSFVSAANLGLSPARIEFDEVLRGGYAERVVRMTVDADDDVGASVSTWGDVAEWIAVSGDRISASRSSPGELLVSVTPPSDTPNGVYEGFVRVTRDKRPDASLQGATGIIIPTLDLHVVITVTDREITGCRASNFEVLNAEEGDEVFFSFDVENTGNIRFAPLISLDVWNADSSAIVRELRFSDDEVTPTKKERVTVSFSSDGLDIGQYWLDANIVDCYNQQTLTFDVLEEGALFAKGVLNSITAPVWVDVGDTVPFLVSFSNVGEKPLQTRFKGRVSSGSKVVQIIESDESLFVPLDSTEEFSFYFTPKDAGRYVFSGRVFYDSKRTYEKSAVINVRSKGVFWSSVLQVLVYVVLIALIAFLLSRIRRERNLMRGGFRKFR